jgi:periplasmic divalent cation tolerance protein
LKESYIIVMVTTGTKTEAETIVQKLLEKKLIACGNILGPISSHFHWSGKIETAEEYLVLLKSCGDLFDELAEAVKTVHSYDVPEILAFPVVKGSKDYLDWLGSVLK